jgi:hypothetical protein
MPREQLVPGDIVTYDDPDRRAAGRWVFDPNTFKSKFAEPEPIALGIVISVYEVPVDGKEYTSTYCDVLFSSPTRVNVQ